MPSKQDVLTERDTSIADLDVELVRFAGIQNAASQADSDAMEPHMEALRKKRTSVAVQDYKAALNDPALEAALTKIKAATKNMKEVAEIMKNVATFLANVAGLLGAVGAIGSALQ